MFLEKIEIFGFKAIPYRLNVKFGSGITSIIGPNGCGKSNFSDAIRWVLGEQSARHLRGHAMEDVIFNGAAGRKPLGMAEVFLTFSNSRGKLPIDFNTVTVGRRLYRSGQSDYLINRAPCRLRDIKDLLLDTGIGSSGYAMIAREMVEAVLSDDSGQRRILLEEAAGVAKYKQRKREALAKLKGTEADLVRVADIVSEVEREVRSLGRQVGKARRYRRYLERIRQLDLALGRERTHHLAARRDELDPLLAAHQVELEGARAQQSQLELELEERRIREVELRAALSAAQSELDDLDRRLGGWDSEAKVLRERRTATDRRVVEATEEVARLEARRSINRELLERAAAAVAELTETEAGQAVALRGREAELRRADEGWRGARTSLRERQQLQLDLVEDHAGRKAHLEQVSRRREELEIRMVGRRGERDQAAAELGRRDQERLATAGQLETMRTQHDDTTEHLAEAEEHVGALEVRQQQLTEQVGMVSERVAGDESRLEVLFDLKKRYEGHARGVQSLLSDGRPADLLGTVAELLRVPSDLVEAIDTALAHASGFVVSERRDASGAHIDRLRDGDAGRATFLPLDTLNGVRPPRQENGGNGVLGNATDLVEAVDPRAKPVIDYLLGDVIVVEGREDAIRLVASASVNGHRVVTRAGELWTATGPVSGGASSTASSSPLGREQEIATLEQELVALRGELEAAQGDRRRVADELDNAVIHRGELRQRVDGERQTIFELEKALQAAEHGLHAQTESIAEIDRTTSEFEREIAELDSESRQVGDLLASARSKSDDFEAHHAELSTHVHELEEAREECQRAEQAARLSWTETIGRLSEARADDERQRAESQLLESELERRHSEISEGQALVEELSGTVARLEEQVRDGLQTRESLVGGVREAETKHSEVHTQNAEIEERARRVRREIDAQVECVHAEELELERVRSEIESMSARVREEYEVELLETRESLDEGQTIEEATSELTELRDRMRTLGPVNLLAIEQFDEIKERFDFLTRQRDDLTRAREELLEAIEHINQTASTLFRETFDTVRDNFRQVFSTLFEGGEAELKLVGDDLDGLIEILARPGGKNLRSVSLMSGGERALTAISLLFAIYLAKPSPFCIMDEVDAPLDDANIDRFVNLLKSFSAETQFIVITHNKKTMAAAERLYGVTMEEPGVSKLVSVRLDQGEIRESERDEVERRESGETPGARPGDETAGGDNTSGIEPNAGAGDSETETGDRDSEAETGDRDSEAETGDRGGTEPNAASRSDDEGPARTIGPELEVALGPDLERDDRALDGTGTAGDDAGVERLDAAEIEAELDAEALLGLDERQEMETAKAKIELVAVDPQRSSESG